MTLDPVHFEGITRLARRIEQCVGDGDHREFAETVWTEFLDPLYDDGDVVLEPLADHRRRAVEIDDAALQEPVFPTQHGLDSGTMNPTQFRNGIVVDVAQAAMSASPSDLELHRGRTLVATVHTNDPTASVDESDWVLDDEGYMKQRIMQAPRVNQYERTVVHELALYLAESTHALQNAGDVDDLLVLDGPIYPKGMLNWATRESELADLLRDERPRDIIENYVRLVETFVNRDVPLVGFVKTPTTRAITRTVREQRGRAPWVNDAGFFTQVLERGETTDEGFERDTDALTFTDWFRSTGGADGAMAAEGTAFGIDRHLDAEAYEVTFFAIYDPRSDVLYRVEAPYAFTRRESLREDLARHVLAEVAAQRGPPLPVGKADELAKIGQQETVALRDALAAAFDAEADTDYNDERWGLL